MPKTVRHGLAWRSELFFSRCRIACARLDLLTPPAPPRPHGLPFPLVVSLTSWPARFPILALTLRSLLRQSVRPDRLVLWIARPDIDRLPAEVTALQGAGLEIAATDDIRSYKKIVPALRAWPDAAIVTADDDLYYARDWLAALVEGWQADPGSLPAHRAHEVRLDPDGRPLPYRQWKFDVAEGTSGSAVFPTSGAGVLYPPRALPTDTTRADLFTHLAPLADDIWLYCMARLARLTFRKVGPRRRLVTWQTEQPDALSHFNLTHGGNDLQLGNVLDHYGAALQFGAGPGK